MKWLNWDVVSLAAVMLVCLAVILGFIKGPVKFCMDTSVRGCPTRHGGGQ